jgi:hypothetical protein
MKPKDDQGSHGRLRGGKLQRTVAATSRDYFFLSSIIINMDRTAVIWRKRTDANSAAGAAAARH